MDSHKLPQCRNNGNKYNKTEHKDKQCSGHEWKTWYKKGRKLWNVTPTRHTKSIYETVFTVVNTEKDVRPQNTKMKHKAVKHIAMIIVEDQLM